MPADLLTRDYSGALTPRSIGSAVLAPIAITAVRALKMPLRPTVRQETSPDRLPKHGHSTRRPWRIVYAAHEANPASPPAATPKKTSWASLPAKPAKLNTTRHASKATMPRAMARLRRELKPSVEWRTWSRLAKSSALDSEAAANNAPSTTDQVHGSNANSELSMPDKGGHHVTSRRRPHTVRDQLGMGRELSLHPSEVDVNRATT